MSGDYQRRCPVFGILAVLLLSVCLSDCEVVVMADEAGLFSANALIGKSFVAKDSLAKPVDDLSDARQCLEGLCWTASEFSVACIESDQFGCSAALTFHSAVDSGHAENDQVVVEWYGVTNKTGLLQKAPAVVVVHESGRGMTVGRMVARGLRDRGLHAFMVQLPFYGSRRPPGMRSEDQEFATLMRQGIADVRRTLDAVKTLPAIDGSKVSLQGTSLRGFIAATTAGLDDAFYRTFILLAGGNLPNLVARGQRETADLRELLKRQGYEGERVHDLLNRFEPNRLAHRINKDRLWLYAATFDTVVTAESTDSFAKASGVASSHYIKMPANHYSGVLFLPMVLDNIVKEASGAELVRHD